VLGSIELPSSQPRKLFSAKDRRRTLILASIIIATSLIAVVWAAWLLQDSESGYDEYYHVRIDAVDTDEYVIRLPVPCDEVCRMPPYFIGEIEVEAGEPVFALAEYDHGFGLEIRSRGYLEFDWSKELSGSWDSGYGNLTMTAGLEDYGQPNEARSWIFSDSSDIRIVLSYSSIHFESSRRWTSGGGPTFEFDGYPNGTGWQSVPIQYGWLVIN
jgi:hypothetical protein